MARQSQWLALANASRRIRPESIGARGPTIYHIFEAALVAEAQAPSLLNHLKHTKRRTRTTPSCRSSISMFLSPKHRPATGCYVYFSCRTLGRAFRNTQRLAIHFQPLRSIAYHFSISPRQSSTAITSHDTNALNSPYTLTDDRSSPLIGSSRLIARGSHLSDEAETEDAELSRYLQPQVRLR